MAVNRRFVFILAPLAVALVLGAQRRPSKRPQVEVVRLAAARQADGTLSIDGRLKNSGEKPLENVTLVFNLLAPGKEIVSAERGELDEEVLDPGQEAEFHWAMKDNPRAVKLTISAEDHSGNEVTVLKPGPYTIE
jgi:hypothetical protein